LYYQMKGEIEIFVIQINLSTYWRFYLTDMLLKDKQQYKLGGCDEILSYDIFTSNILVSFR
jgi:hypothetical protein